MTLDGQAQRTSRAPVLFVGHGSPVNALEDNTWSRSFRALATWLPKPSAILAISAHWHVPGTLVTGNAHPRTIHDFSGFAYELFKVEYRAPGSLELAKRVVDLLGPKADISNDWGLDHGTWGVLIHLRPEADCPVVQLSLDVNLAPAEHLALGRKLAPLRDDKVLLLASGNLTHNLRYAMTHALNDDLATPDWASQFDAEVARAVEQHDTDFLVHALDSDAGRMAHPTVEHYLPLLYAVGASHPDDPIRFPVTGFDMGSLSMRAAMFG
jgi:4,5-DOPA dioxygenase extradiol